MTLTRRSTLSLLGLSLATGLFGTRAHAAAPGTISTADLAAMLKKAGAPKPMLIHVGFKSMFDQAHIPGSEYIGPGADGTGIGTLRRRLAPLKRDTAMVLYCGCCPWSHCPNMRPAGDLAASMGFTNVKLLMIDTNFGADWVSKGYPTERTR
jgi:hypothetical protein